MSKTKSKQTHDSKDDTLEILSGQKPYPADEEKADIKYSPEEATYRASLIQKLCYSRDEREQNHPEFDGMTYTQYFESNRKKDLSYIPPKTNRNDIRVVTGTTREKSTTLLSTLLNLELTPLITAFDEDDIVVANLGNVTADLVKKSREIEDYDVRKSTIYREFLSQGDVFCEEYYATEYMPIPVNMDGVDTWKPDKNKISDFKDPEFKLKKTFEGCKMRMIKGTKVYLGSVRIENIQDQEMVAIQNVYPRATAESMYGTWDRWQYVPENVDDTTLPVDEGSLYRDWNVSKVPKGHVAELRIYLPKHNRFMIMLNGVMMLPINYPMTAVSRSHKLPITQGKNEPISGFAYSKSVPSKTKVDQEMLDEFIKLIYEKLRQSAKPSMGSTGKQLVHPSVLNAGKITSNMKANQMFPILPPENRTLTGSDFSFYKLIKEQIDEKTVNAVYSGQAPQGKATATEVVQQKNQQMLKLGLTLDGIINFERQAVWHRIFNIYTNWTKAKDIRVDKEKNVLKEVYKTHTVETEIENDEKGYKIYRFAEKEDYPADKYEQYHEEEKLSKEYDKPVRITYLDPKELCLLKYLFFVQVVPSHKNNTEVNQMLFINNVREAMELFGPESLEIEHIKQRFANKIGENYDKFFKSPDMVDQMNEMAAKGGKGGPRPARENTKAPIMEQPVL